MYLYRSLYYIINSKEILDELLADTAILWHQMHSLIRLEDNK